MAESLIAQLASQALVEASQVLGVYNDLQHFTQTLSYIKAVLLDAEQKQNHDYQNFELSEWLWLVRDVLSDAKNVLDEVEFENLRKKVIKAHSSSRNMIITKVNNLFSSSNPLVFRFRMARKMKQINTRLDKIAADRHKFGFSIVDADNHIVHRRELTYSSVIDSEVIGRERDKEKIIKLLIHRDNNKNLAIVPIVGLGGVGKTTLAKLVFNDERIDAYFPLKMWVCVSGSFDIKQVIIKIISSANESTDATTYQQNLRDLDIQQLQNHLKSKLKGQMFLLVLDDVWNEDRVKWVELKDLIQVGAVGSQLLVTTRNHSIASMMGTIPSHILVGLSLEDSLLVFVKWAFKEGEAKKYPHLVDIGRDIVKKCGGIPLALRTLGSSLFSKYDTDEWECVRDNQIWNCHIRNAEDTGNILHALKLSYYQMPCYLKECFALFSLYPKDHAFDSFDIASLWRAHDLLPPPIINQTMKYSANQFLFELLSISFLQDFIDYGIGFSFKMHDLVHSCAARIALVECKLVTDSIEGRRRVFVRHLSFPENKGLDKFPIQRFKKLRSILFPTAGIGANSDAFLVACTSSCKHLRFLDLSDSTYETLPQSIGKLKHLRYLSLENNRNLKRLPDSICNLVMLEMLILSGCTELDTLPKGLRKLISLQHLEITTKQFALPEDEIANLSSLQTLRIEFCNNLESLFGEIKLPALKVLCVANCRNLKSLPLDIEHVPALETLLVDNCDTLEFSEGCEDQISDMRLKVLTIVSLHQLVTLPRWLQGSVNTLQYLSISSCNNLVALPQCLSAMNCLKTICITGCPNIMSLPNDIHCLNTLERLEIDGYPELLRKSQQEVGESSHTHNTTDEPDEVEEELE
ncbi:disease resistance protein rga2-like [Trifolium pratense]|uniref:Disease resistance protein rga2-like n=1 Tax=Trifolium pratense TaxID=57577 RepID=A0A2K3MPP7_TRIPR|nr:disease resistance protein rga2-like [Trifolium pratense]